MGQSSNGNALLHVQSYNMKDFCAEKTALQLLGCFAGIPSIFFRIIGTFAALPLIALAQASQSLTSLGGGTAVPVAVPLWTH